MRAQSAAEPTTSISMSAARYVRSIHPDGKNDGFYSISAGPIFRAPMQNFTLFAHGLVGGGHLGGPNSENPYLPQSVSVGTDADGWRRHGLRSAVLRQPLLASAVPGGLSLDPCELWSDGAVPTAGILGGRANLSAAELSTGIVMHFGHIIPPPPVTYSCSVSPATVFPGDPITVTGTALNLNPKKTATYTWTADGGTISGNSSTANDRHQDCESRHLHGEGSCHRGREAWRDGGLLGHLHGEAV